MKLMVVIPIWKREIITNLLLDWYDRFEFQIVVVGSEGGKSRRMAKNFMYVEAPNYPLDAKYDIGISYCRSYNPDAVALVGSDDFITRDYFDWALNQVDLGFDMMGLLDFYLADILKSKIYYWGGYTKERTGDTIGAGRVFSKKILDAVGWKPFVGDNGYEHMFKDDERSEKNILAAGGRINAINMANIGCRYWAIKSGNEINPTKAFQDCYDLVDITQFSNILMESDLKIEEKKIREFMILLAARNLKVF